jgi:hypothetical protein
MIALQKDPNAELLKSYLPPFKGTWKTLPPYLLPDDVVQDSMNITLSGGLLRSRGALKSFNAANLGNKIIGSFLTTDTNKDKFPICSTKDKVYLYTSNAWFDITAGIALTATDESQVRMSSIQLGTQVYVLYANGVDTVKIIPQNTYNLENIIPRAGTLPVFDDVCTSFSRFVGIQAPYTVAWCDVINNFYLSYTSWPALNQVILADTEDALVAIRPLGTLGVAVYKEGNIFVGFGQAGANSAAFRFEHRGEYEGPGGANAVVNVNGTHVYMTGTGRVGLFDGTQHDWICDGLWPYLQQNLDTAYAQRIFGVYNYRTAEVTFWYPRVGDSGALHGMLVICLPFPLAGVQSFSYFLGSSAFSCTNGLSVRLFQGDKLPLIFGNNNETFVIDHTEYIDKFNPFNCSFKTGLFKPPTPQPPQRNLGDIYRPTLEIYSTRSAERGLLHVAALTSQMLKDEGTHSIPEIIDLTSDPVNEFIAFNDTGSFLGVEFEWQSSAKFEYKGCDVYGRATP